MANHPNRSKVRYFEVRPRRFINEVTYIRVRPEEVEAVEKHFDGYIDRMFDLDETGANCGWTTITPHASISWEDYRRDLI